MSANFQSENFQIGREATRDVTNAAIARSAYEDPGAYLAATAPFRGADTASMHFGNLTLTSENDEHGTGSSNETEYAPRRFFSSPPPSVNEFQYAPEAPAPAPNPSMGDVISEPGMPAPEALRSFMNYFKNMFDTQTPEAAPPATTFEFENVPDAPAPESVPPANGSDGVALPEAPASKTGQEQDNPSQNQVLRSAENLVGTPVTDLEHGINPRLGCARMVSHALHEADPSFPETNNSKVLDRLLKEHGYEAVTVKPGDPALTQSQPGDVLIGHRPDGMPSHAAISMGDGKVFNNNSDSGQGQIDSLSQFQQGMHDSAGNWNKNGFADVTVYRKLSS